MMKHVAPSPNDDQPIGLPLLGWTPPPHPARRALEGRYCRLEPLDAAAHAESLHAANSESPGGRIWTYLPYGPFASLADYSAWAAEMAESRDPLFFAIVDLANERAVGVATLMRIAPEAGSIEVGHINYAPALQGTRAATEAMDLLRRQVFSLGYRRYEWKCDALNAGSRRAAQRLGFSFEGVFRQATVYKNRNRDTAWFAMIDSEAAALDAAFDRWLDPANFDEDGRQRLSLSSLTAPILVATD